MAKRERPERAEPVTVRMPLQLVEQLKELAAEDKRSLSQWVRLLLEDEVERRKAAKKGGKR